MKTILISAAALALLAAPAFAQPQDRHVGKAALAPHQQNQAQQQLRSPGTPQAGRPGPNGLVMAPAGAMPPRTDGRDIRPGNDNRGGNRGNRGPAAAAPAAAPAAPAQAQRQDNRRSGNNNNFGGNNNRGRDNSNFGNRSPNNNSGNRGGFNNNRGNAGPRRDYSSFRGYHQNNRSSRRFRGPSYNRPSGWYSRRWTFGEILPALFWSQQYWLTNYNTYDLPPPPYGTVWVRDGNDALLVDRDTGEIISVEYDVFY